MRRSPDPTLERDYLTAVEDVKNLQDFITDLSVVFPGIKRDQPADYWPYDKPSFLRFYKKHEVSAAAQAIRAEQEAEREKERIKQGQEFAKELRK